jgi:hypothetical protein
LQDLKARFGYAPQVLAITGTNGKTTVTSLTGQLVARAGKTVKVAGNIGPTLLDTLTEAMAQAQVQVEQEAAERAAVELENQDQLSEPPSMTIAQESVTPASPQDESIREMADAGETLDSLDGETEELARKVSEFCTRNGLDDLRYQPEHETLKQWAYRFRANVWGWVETGVCRSTPYGLRDRVEHKRPTGMGKLAGLLLKQARERGAIPVEEGEEVAA